MGGEGDAVLGTIQMQSRIAVQLSVRSEQAGADCLERNGAVPLHRGGSAKSRDEAEFDTCKLSHCFISKKV